MCKFAMQFSGSGIVDLRSLSLVIKLRLIQFSIFNFQLTIGNRQSQIGGLAPLAERALALFCFIVQLHRSAFQLSKPLRLIWSQTKYCGVSAISRACKFFYVCRQILLPAELVKLFLGADEFYGAVV